MLVIAVILWGVIIAAVVGALHHLMKRPHLTGEQKLIALLVSSVITVPVCGLLFPPIAFLAAVLLPFGNFSVGEEALSDRGRYGLKSGCDIAWEGAPPSGILVVRPPDAGDPRCAFPANAIRCKKRLNRIYLTSPSHN